MIAALVVAGLLTIMVGTVHSWLGEQRLVGPLLSPERRNGVLQKSAFARQVLRFAWHLTTVAWWGIAAILLVQATSPLDHKGRLTLVAIGITFFINGLITLIVSRGRHLAWPVFLVIAGLSALPLF